MAFREDYLGPLRTCLDGVDDWHRVESCFQQHVKDNEIEDARPVVYAFGYMLVTGGREELRERTGVFAPRIEWENGAAFPAPLAEIPEEMLGIWAEYADATADSAVAASRLHDLLWVRRFGEPAIEHARAAVDGYLELAESWESMNLVESLSRAIEISREVKDTERLNAAIEKAIGVIEEEMATEEWRPGIPMNLLEAIADLKPEHRPENFEELLEAAGERYGDDPYIAQSVSKLQAAILPPQERVQLQKEQVARWREEAKKATGILRYARLQQALELARTHGLSEVADAILVEVQSMSAEDLELKRISAEVEVPREKIDAYVKSFADGPESWQAAYERFGAEGPPSGDVAANAELTQELAGKHPLTRILAQQVLGAESSLVFDASEDDQHERLDVAQHEALRIRLWAPIGAEIIEAIKGKFGTPDHEELIDFFTTKVIDRAVATRIADGVLRFLGGDDDGALHILIPQIEAAIRGAAARLGIVVIKNPQGERPGGVRQLGALLADLSGRVDESWRRYLVNALNDSLGVNLRDQVSHGLYGSVARGDVAVAIHIACQLRLWILTGEERGAGGEAAG